MDTPQIADHPAVWRHAGTPADVQAEVTWVLLAGATLICLITMALLVGAWRRRDPAASERPWTWGWGLAWPAAVLTALGIYGVLRDRQAMALASQDPPIVVGVTGHMWWWDVRQRIPGTAKDIRLANEIHIPTGRTVQLGLSSGDVIHSFWVPQLGGKVDMVPGRVNQLRLRATRPGVYRGQCAEFCGTQHARMVLHVVAHAPADYERWLARESAPALQPGPQPSDALALRGQQAFLRHGCAACHAIRGLTEQGRLGPDLTHVGSRLALGAGVLRNEAGAVAAWISGVQALKPSARMPAHAGLDADTLNALGAYLSGLR